MFKPTVNFCCIKSLSEARLALRFGANMLGFVSDMPSGPGVLPLVDIATIIQQLPRSTKSVQLTSALSAGAIHSQQSQVKAWGIQLVDYLDIDELIVLRKTLPDIRLFQVIHIENISAVDLAMKYLPYIDFLLLDSGSPGLKNKVLGGTGLVHDWKLSREICTKSSKPVFLAGGLNANNVKDALELVQPYGIDLCGGLRAADRLQKNKVREFFGVF